MVRAESPQTVQVNRPDLTLLKNLPFLERARQFLPFTVGLLRLLLHPFQSARQARLKARAHAIDEQDAVQMVDLVL